MTDQFNAAREQASNLQSTAQGHLDTLQNTAQGHLNTLKTVQQFTGGKHTRRKWGMPRELEM